MCLVLDNGAGRVLVDLGTMVLDRFAWEDLLPLDAVLFTHRHADHFDERVVGRALDRGCRLVANPDVAALLGSGDLVTVTSSGSPLEVAGFSVTPYDVPHMPMVDESPPPPNTGYVVDGGFIHPGDAMEFPVSAPTLALPIAGPGASFRDAYVFLEETGATTVLPIHHDVFVAEPQMFADRCSIADVVIIIAPGDTVEV